jgi:hypothetical protein
VEISRQALLYGLLCTPVGIAIGLFIALDSAASGFRYFYLYSGLAAFMTASFMWWLLIGRPEKPSGTRAVAVGALSGLLSHWLCWYLMLLWVNVDFYWLGGSGSSLGEAPITPLPGLVAVFAFCFWSWLYFGWLTVAAAVAIALFRARAVRTLS